MPQSFELLINIKNGNIAGGGLQRSGYVETHINGQLFDTTDTVAPPLVWNQNLFRSFTDGYSEASQSVLSFAVYKKRWTSYGFKLVGTLDIPLVRLIPNLNNGSILQSHALKSAKKNVTMMGSLTIGLELKESAENIERPISPFVLQGLFSKEESRYEILNRRSSMDKKRLSEDSDWYISDGSSTNGSLSNPSKLNGGVNQSYDTEEESLEILLTASCFCKKNHILTSAVPKQIKYCHCLNCQSSSGGPYLLQYIFDSTQCSDIHGESIQVKSAGKRVVYKCANCYSTICEADENNTFLTHGVIDKSQANFKLLNSDSFKPSMHVFYDSRFADVTDNLPKYSCDDNSKPTKTLL